MEVAHAFNLTIHIGAGAIGIFVGMVILAGEKGSAWHRRAGRVFAVLALIVSATATLGLIAFRFTPLFAVLTVLTSYQLVSGWRCARTKHQGPLAFDALWTAAAITATVALLPYLFSPSMQGSARPMVVLSTLAALAVILCYDAARWLFPRRWYARLWRFEHIYKLISSFGALTSAFAGNVLTDFQPWSQLLPSLLGMALIAYFFWRSARGSVRA